MAGGADDLNVYDAACIALAHLEERHSATEFTMNAKGLKGLMEAVGIDGLGTAQDEVESFMVENGMTRKAKLPRPEDVPTAKSVDPMGEMAALRASKSTPPKGE